jgi:hypothetical protein
MSITTNLALNEPAYNSTSPTWDQPLNYNSTILDQVFGNTTGVAVSTGATTYTNITAPSSSAAGSTSQCMRFNFTGALSANQNVLLPQSVSGMWVITNSTSGAYSVSLWSNNGSNVPAGTGVVCPQGYSILVYCDGTNVKKADDGLTASGIVSSFSAGSTGLTPSSATTGAVTLSGVLNVANGGTGTGSLSGGVLIGNGTSAITSLAPSTSGNVLTSNGSSWVSQAPAATVGVGTTWTNYTGSRALGTTYTNSTGKLIFISVFTTSQVSNILVTVNGVVIFQNSWGGSANNSTAFSAIPPGATYSVSGGNLATWFECV